MDENIDIAAKFKDFEKYVLTRLVAFELQITGLIEAVNVMQRKMQKLDEVYYHIFPDRFDKDFEFERQLLALKGAPDPDAGNERS